MELAFSTTAVAGWELGRIVDTAGRLGFSGIELAGFDDDPAAPLLKSAEAMRDTLAPAGLHICSLATSIALHHPAEAQWRREREALQHVIGIAREAGAGAVRVFGHIISRRESLSQATARIGGRLKELSHLAREAGAGKVSVALQNGGSFVRARELWLLLEAAGNPDHAGICWNVAEPHSDVPSLAVPTLNSRIRLAHVDDRDAAGKSAPLGAGIVPLRTFVERLAGIGYHGALVYDPPSQPRPENAETLLDAAATTLRALLPAKPSESPTPRPQK